MKRDTSGIRETSCHPVEGGAVIFHPGRKKLFALNDTAAFIWSVLQDDAAEADVLAILQGTFGIDASEAGRWLAQTLFPLQEQTAVSGEEVLQRHVPSGRPDLPAETEEHSADYLLLGQRVRIAATEPTLDLLTPLLGRLRETSASGNGAVDVLLTIQLVESASYLVKDGEGETVASTGTLMGIVEQAIVQSVVPRTPHLLTFHAALLKHGETGLLMAAPSGSGKSTLSVALEHRGWDFGSDELALFGQDHSLRGVALPPCIKSENFDLIRRWHPEIDDLAEQERFSRTVKFLPLAAKEFRAKVRNVVFPAFSGGTTTRLEPMAALDGLSELLTQCVFIPNAFTAEDVTTLLSWHQNVRYWRLPFSDCDAAVQRLNTLD